MKRKAWERGVVTGLAMLLSIHLSSVSLAQDGTDLVTGFPREPIRVATWPGGKKVTVSFALFVEVFGLGQGPVFRPDLMSRNPDLVNEANTRSPRATCASHGCSRSWMFRSTSC